MLLFFISLLIFILFLFFIFRFLHSHFLFDVIPHPSVGSHWVFTPILYFQPSPSQSDSGRFHFQPVRYLLATSGMIHYGLELAFFTHRRSLPYAPSLTL